MEKHMPSFVLDLSWSESGWQSYLGFCGVPKGRDGGIPLNGGMALPLASHLQAGFVDVICLLTFLFHLVYLALVSCLHCHWKQFL